ncbi:MAG: hypothetical protein AAF614_33800 [Chloroflexota bacterium]
MSSVKLLFMAFLFGIAGLFQSSTIEADTLAVAEKLYENGRYAEAAQTYQQLVDQGYGNAGLYYNLGNAYFKADDKGRAVLNLERAARLAPRDGTINSELAFMQEQIQADAPDIGLDRVAQMGQAWLTLNETAVLALLLWWLLLALLWARRRSPRWQAVAEWGWQLTAVLLLLSLVMLGSRFYVSQTQPTAIVVASEVGVSQAPGGENTGALVLWSGTAVRVLDQRAQWSEIAAANGQGWVPNRSIELISSR